MDTELPFDTANLTSSEVDLFLQICNTLKVKFHIELTGHIDFYLEDFEVFRPYAKVSLKASYAIKNENNDSYFLFIENSHRLVNKGHVSECCEYQCWAIVYLKHDFGRVLIRPETLSDKILELIHPVELDFADDKTFSDIYYVLVNDQEKATEGMNRSFRNAVMDVREYGFVIEIVSHTLIIGNTEPMTPEKAIHLAEFASRICNSC